MALTVETGAGSSTSESYLSVADFKAYCDKMGYDWAGVTASEDTDIEAALRRGTSSIDARVRARLGGARPLTTTQALLFPISGGVDTWGHAIASDGVPRQIVVATAEAAWRELQTPGSMAPDVAAGGKVISRVKAGETEVEYAMTNASPTTSFSTIDNILAGLFGATSPYSGRTVRA